MSGDEYATERIEVKGPVTVTVGPAYVSLFPYMQVQCAVDDYDVRPWAWGAMCRLKFKIGELTTTKKVQVKHTYGVDWNASASRPAEDELAAGRVAVLTSLRERIARHGFDPPDLHVIDMGEVEPWTAVHTREVQA